MSEEEDFDEFPSISVNSSIHESSSFSMPSAEELATQRAREADCESALLRLREEHERAHRECVLMAGVRSGGAGSAAPAPAPPAHSDSSGSEGEAALAAAVSALRVLPAAPAPPAPAPAPLAPALLAHLPGEPLLAAYSDAARRAHYAHPLIHDIAASASEMVVEAATSEDVQVWPTEEILGITAWLCVVLTAPPPPRGAPGGAGAGGRRTLLRTLHLLIEDVATDDQIEKIKDLLLSCAGQTGAALQLCDALWGAGSGRGDGLAGALAGRALAVAGGGAAGQDVWRRLPPARQYLALQLAARLLSRGHAGHAAAARVVLAALAQGTPGQRAHSTDQLKVLVAATKLQVLFHVNK